MKIGSDLCPAENIHGFTKIWPSDLVFDPKWPIFNCGPAFIKINILTNFHDEWIKTVPHEGTHGFTKIWPSDPVLTQNDLFFYSGYILFR